MPFTRVGFITSMIAASRALAQVNTGTGSGVIWNIIPYETPVIPAKAGIQSVDSAFPKVCGVDSRLRGNDCGLGRPFLANDTTTWFSFHFSYTGCRWYYSWEF